MTDNAMHYMFSRLEDCCGKHFYYDYENCVGFRSTPISGLFYPDWTGQDHVCRNDGNQPQVSDRGGSALIVMLLRLTFVNSIVAIASLATST